VWEGNSGELRSACVGRGTELSPDQRRRHTQTLDHQGDRCGHVHHQLSQILCVTMWVVSARRLLAKPLFPKGLGALRLE
jgi:hypothetical protein